MKIQMDKGLDMFLRTQNMVSSSEDRSIYEVALDEIAAGKKRSHWVWFIFPQLRALGSSRISVAYGISGIQQAIEYLEHPILGARLRICSEALLAHKGKSAADIMDEVDAVKLRSCMTLFAHASGERDSVFHRVLRQFYQGKEDAFTNSILRSQTLLKLG